MTSTEGVAPRSGPARGPGRLVVVAAGLLWLAATGPAAALGLSVLADGTPALATAGAELDVPLQLRNDGSVAWTPQDGYAVAYHLLDAEGATVEWDGVRTPLPAAVPAGGTVGLTARLVVPSATGDYRVAWDVVQEHVRWVSAADPAPDPGAPLAVRPRHAAGITAAGPRWLVLGGTATARVTVVNRGTLEWPADGSVAVAYHWYRPDGGVVEWDGRRTPLPKAVPPGGEVTVEATVDAPSVAGRLLLEWDLVHEGVTWFSQQDPEPRPRLPVRVVALPPAAVVASLAIALAALGLAWCGRRRHPLPADLVWLAAVVLGASAWVLGAAGEPVAVAAWCLSSALAALLGAIAVVLPGRWRRLLVILAGLAVLLLAEGDVLHLRFFGDLPSLASLGAAGQLDEVEASIVSLLRPGDLWLAVMALAGLAIVVLQPVERVRRRALPVAVLGVAAVLAAGVGVALAAGDGGGELLRQVFRNLYLAREIGVLPYHAVDAARVAGDRWRRGRLDAAGEAAVVDWFRRTAPHRAGVGPRFGAAAGANLVMIQVESLQTFVVGMEVDGQPVMPTLARWRSETVYAPALTDQTAAGRSSDAELATQASLLPPDHGVAVFRFPANHFTGLAGILAERGYATLSAVPFDGSFWNRRTTHRAWGYQTSLFADDFGAGPKIGWGLNDRDFFLQAADRVAALEQPFCAWLLTLSLHHPFEGFPDRFKSLRLGDLEGTPFGNYLHTMHWLDGAIARLEDRLGELGLADHTVVAVWGDHDAGFEWTPSLAARLGWPPDPTGWYLSQTVPLFVRLPPGTGDAVALEVPAGHVDVAPTLLALLGVDPAPYAVLGRNLLGAPGDGPVLGEYRCWRDRRLVFLQGGPHLADGECRQLDGLAPVPVADCAAGYREAMTRVRVSDLVLAHDLQQEVHRQLARHPGTGG